MKLQKFWVLIIALVIIYMVALHAMLETDVFEETPEFTPENVTVNEMVENS